MTRFLKISEYMIDKEAVQTFFKSGFIARSARHQRGKVVQFSGFARKLNHPLLFLRAKRAKNDI
jgi:hypothetical protein